MDTHDAPATQQNLSPLDARREALRAFSDEVMAAIKTLPMPQTWLEGERAMRCIATTDRVLVQIFQKSSLPMAAWQPYVRPFAPRYSPPQTQPDYVPEPDEEPESDEGDDADFIYQYDDDEIEDTPSDNTAEPTDETAQTLDAVLSEIDACLSPAPQITELSPKDRAQSYRQLAQTFASGRDLLHSLSP